MQTTAQYKGRGTSRQCDAAKCRDSPTEERSLRPQLATRQENISAVVRDRPSHKSSGQRPGPRDGGTAKCTQQRRLQEPTHDGCLHTTGAYSRQVPTHEGCLLTTGAYSRRVPTHDGCLLTTGAYSRRVRTHDGCVLTTGAYSRQVCTRDSVDPSSLQAITVDSRQKVVPLIFEVAPLFKTENASSAMLTTERPTLLFTPDQAESAIEHVAGGCSL